VKEWQGVVKNENGWRKKTWKKQSHWKTDSKKRKGENLEIKHDVIVIMGLHGKSRGHTTDENLDNKSSRLSATNQLRKGGTTSMGRRNETQLRRDGKKKKRRKKYFLDIPFQVFSGFPEKE